MLFRSRAVQPERKSRPQRARIVIVTAILAFLAALLWALVRDAHERAKRNPEQSRRIDALRDLLRRNRS